MHTRGLFTIVVLLLAASFLATFLDPSITGDVIRSSRQQPVSVISSANQEKALSSLQTLVNQQFPSAKTPSSPQKSRSSGAFMTRLICPWETRTCEASDFIKKEFYPATSEGASLCMQQALESCQKASKNAAIEQVKLCSKNAQTTCAKSNTRSLDRVPEKFCFFKKVSDITVHPCIINALTLEGESQYCFALFSDQGTLQQPLRCQSSGKSGPLQLSCSATYKVSSTHSCRVDSVIKSASKTLTY